MLLWILEGMFYNKSKRPIHKDDNLISLWLKLSDPFFQRSWISSTYPFHMKDNLNIHTFLVCGNCDVLLPSHSSIFCFYHVLVDNTSGYLPRGDHPFFNFWVVLFRLFVLFYFVFLMCLKCTWKKATFSDRFLNCC